MVLRRGGGALKVSVAPSIAGTTIIMVNWVSAQRPAGVSRSLSMGWILGVQLHCGMKTLDKIVLGVMLTLSAG